MGGSQHTDPRQWHEYQRCWRAPRPMVWAAVAAAAPSAPACHSLILACRPGSHGAVCMLISGTSFVRRISVIMHPPASIHPRDYLESGGIGVPSLRESTHLTHAWQPDSSAANPAAMIYLPIIDQYLSTHQYQHLSHSNRSRDIFRLLSQATRWGIPYSRATIRVRFQGKAEAHKNHDSLLPITLPLPLYNYLIILAHSHSSFTGKCGWCASCYVGGPFLKLQARSKGYLLTRGA